MLRVKRSVLLGVLIGLSSQSRAVGLGDIALESYVNEPLQANIVLLDTGSLAEPAIDEDAIETNLELARAYIDMGDHDGAKELLDSVLAKGDLSQQAAAQELLKTLP